MWRTPGEAGHAPHGNSRAWVEDVSLVLARLEFSESLKLLCIFYGVRSVPLSDLRTLRPGQALRGAAFGARLWSSERGCACHLARVPGLTSASRTNWEHRRQQEATRRAGWEAPMARACPRVRGVPHRMVRYAWRLPARRGALGREPCLCALPFRAQVSGFQNCADLAFLRSCVQRFDTCIKLSPSM